MIVTIESYVARCDGCYIAYVAADLTPLVFQTRAEMYETLITHDWGCVKKGETISVYCLDCSQQLVYIKS